MDGNGNYYHVEKGKEKRYIACNTPRPGEEDFHTVMERLKEEAGRRAGIAQRKQLQEEEQKRLKRLEEIRDALPFRMRHPECCRGFPSSSDDRPRTVGLLSHRPFYIPPTSSVQAPVRHRTVRLPPYQTVLVNLHPAPRLPLRVRSHCSAAHCLAHGSPDRPSPRHED